MKSTAIVCAAALLGTVFFSCNASVDSEPTSGNHEQSPSAADKITLSANDIEKVKDGVFSGGKVTLASDVESINASDITFKAEKLGGKKPVVTFEGGKTTQLLTAGDNAVSVNIKEDEYFETANFTITVTKAASSVPSAYEITALSFFAEGLLKNPYKVTPESSISKIAGIWFNGATGTERSSSIAVWGYTDYYIDTAEKRVYFADQLQRNTKVELKDSTGNVLGSFTYNGNHAFTPNK
ncbi:MAG: hypothetical protein ACTTKL_06100 [Treponema sp.]